MRRELKNPESVGVYKGKLKFEDFVAWVLNRLRIGALKQVELAEEQLEATLETNRLLRKLTDEGNDRDE